MKKGAVRAGNNLLRPILIAVIVIAGIAIAYYLIRFRKKENGVRVRV